MGGIQSSCGGGTCSMPFSCRDKPSSVAEVANMNLVNIVVEDYKETSTPSKHGTKHNTPNFLEGKRQSLANPDLHVNVFQTDHN